MKVIDMFKNIDHIGVVYKDFSKIVENVKELYGMPEIITVEAVVEVNTSIK